MTPIKQYTDKDISDGLVHDRMIQNSELFFIGYIKDLGYTPLTMHNQDWYHNTRSGIYHLGIGKGKNDKQHELDLGVLIEELSTGIVNEVKTSDYMKARKGAYGQLAADVDLYLELYNCETVLKFFTYDRKLGHPIQEDYSIDYVGYVGKKPSSELEDLIERITK